MPPPDVQRRLVGLGPRAIWGCTGITEKNMETTIVYSGYTGTIEKKMDTAIVYWGYMWIIENNMETNI